ncbi:DUF6506 family protein [Blastococcus goldschmidtiae]|uniref:DUF6506 family protein n=1 Tax=Blastococcus goldschmidtiae TaxID=3075546 RepID=A0ABU2K926_9ACTN|nr:DUF6506 family protein [Blastococcus sp. DSM 46792]MDT0276694.1 DUF6506 family protein [Blastococcus sp. DSM 46792]
MALQHWTFLYTAPGLPAEGDVRQVRTADSTTVLAGFSSTTAAVEACTETGLDGALEGTQLIELCGAFSHDHVSALRQSLPNVPVGLVGYAGEMTDQLHTLFS